ncbi:LCCL domain-containing protein [Kordiimonas sp.]
MLELAWQGVMYEKIVQIRSPDPHIFSIARKFRRCQHNHATRNCSVLPSDYLVLSYRLSRHGNLLCLQVERVEIGPHVNFGSSCGQRCLMIYEAKMGEIMNHWVKHTRTFASALLVLALVACSGGNDQPGEEDIRNAIAFSLPGGLEVADVEILVTENAGSEVEPLIRNRANVTLEFSDDFVSVVERYGDKAILSKLYTKGQELNGTAITSARLQGNSWSVNIDRFDITRVKGTALGQFAQGTYAFENTEDAAIFKKSYEDKLANQEAERQAAIAAAEKEQADRIAAFRSQIAGTWAAKTPMMRNGGIYMGRDKKTAGVEITFPDGDEAAGIAPFTLYVTDNPNDKLTVDAGFTIAEDGQSVRVRARSNKHKTLNMYLNETWVMDADGQLQAGNSRDRWQVQLEKDGAAVAEKRALAENLQKRDKAIEALVIKHQAGLAPSRFRDMRMKRNTYTPMFVEAVPDANQKIFGDQTYDGDSNIALAAIHSGVLERGEAGVVKVTYLYSQDRQETLGTVKNGVTSGQYRSWHHYTIELIEKLAD